MSRSLQNKTDLSIGSFLCFQHGAVLSHSKKRTQQIGAEVMDGRLEEVAHFFALQTIIGCFIRCNGVVEIELAGSILLVKRTDTLQIAFPELSRIKH